MTLAECFDDYLAIQSIKAENTELQAKLIINGRLRPFFARKKIETIDELTRARQRVWAEFVREEQDRGRSLILSRRYLVSALRSAFKGEQISREFKNGDFPIMEKRQPKGKYIEPERVESILAWLYEKNTESSRCAALWILLAWKLGMRRSEALGLMRSEIDFEKRVILLDAARTKTRRARAEPVPIPDRVWQPLCAHASTIAGPNLFPVTLDSRNRVKPIFKNLRREWDYARSACGVKARFHDLRHSCASDLLANGMPMHSVSAKLGMSVKVLQDIYAHGRPADLERDRAIMAK